jgi:hypothetical protein
VLAVGDAVAVVLAHQIDGGAVGKVDGALLVVFDRQLDRFGEELESGETVFVAHREGLVALALEHFRFVFGVEFVVHVLMKERQSERWENTTLVSLTLSASMSTQVASVSSSSAS